MNAEKTSPARLATLAALTLLSISASARAVQTVRVETGPGAALPAAPAPAAVSSPLGALSAPAAPAMNISPADVGIAPAAASPSAPGAAAAAGLSAVGETLKSLPETARVSPGEAYQSGATIEEALTGLRAAPAAADLVASPSDSTMGQAGVLRPFAAGRRAAGFLAAAAPLRARLELAGRRVRLALDSKAGAALGLAATAAIVALALSGAVSLSLPAAVVASAGMLLMAGTLKEGKNPAYAQGPSPELEAAVKQAHSVIQGVRQEVGKVIVGQGEMVDALIIGGVAGEHVLLEGVPGVAKTQAVKAFAAAIGGQFGRVQGTPDLLPADIIGGMILQEDPETGRRAFQFNPGPIFANVFLADEVNRMMPKTQSAFLEAMQENRATVARQSHELPKPFFVLATQNPIEQEGTYPLSEAQQDRFLLKVIVKNPTADELVEITNRYESKENQPKASQITDLDQLMAIGRLAERIPLDPTIRRYIAKVVEATSPGNSTRAPYSFKEGFIENGASPRAAIALVKVARIHALLAGRAYVDWSDVRAIAPMVLRHRIILGHLAREFTTDQVIEQILAKTPMP